MQRDGGPGPGGGPGGGGNPTGGSFTGAAQALEIIGDHAYGYSGVLDINGTETDMLSFTSGNFYFVGTVQFNYIELNAYHFRYRFYLNDAIPRKPPVSVRAIVGGPVGLARRVLIHTSHVSSSGSFLAIKFPQ